jgi:DNA-binding transcriptional MerR regulator
MSKDSSVRYTASQLGQLSGIGVRNVRYYVREKLIDPPHGRGRGAHFDDSHLSQLGRVRLLQEAGLDHAAIRRYGDDIEAILAKRGVSRREWEKSWAGSGRRIAQVYQRLKATRFVPATSTMTRVTVAAGIDLLVDATRRLPSPAKLQEVVELVRAAFGVTDEATRPGAR